MLQQLSLRNIALVDSLDLELASGLSVITGETGAGKSLIVDALGLLLGDRADAGLVRHGTERADIQGRFDIRQQPAVSHWLQERELDQHDGECLLRRTVSHDGRSRAYVNGLPVTLADLRELGEMLTDIHSQHEHQQLLGKDAARQLLDAHAGLGEPLTMLRQHWRHWQQAQQTYDTLKRKLDDDSARSDFLRFQLDECQGLPATAEALQAVEQEHQQLLHHDAIQHHIASTLALLTENDGNTIERALHQALQQLQAASRHHAGLGDISTLLDSALIEVQEAASSLQALCRDDNNSERLQQLEKQIGEWHRLARKHRVELQALPALIQQFRNELDTLEHGDDALAALTRQIGQHQHDYQQLATDISARRHAAATLMTDAVLASIRQLGMPDARFLTQVERSEAHDTGIDSVSFLFSANPGQPLKALAKVASGGELSRISLALQVVRASVTTVPVLVFDEVDVGIGGATADITGQLLRTLGERAQVITVTHQPQVAARGHQHLHVSKTAVDGLTQSSVRWLNTAERIDEIARMVGGETITDITREHARELLHSTAASSPRPASRKKTRAEV